MARIHRHNVPGGWVARVRGYRESPRPEQDLSPFEQRELDKWWREAPKGSAERSKADLGATDCATAHRKPDGKLFGPDSILRVPQVEIVEPIQPE